MQGAWFGSCPANLAPARENAGKSCALEKAISLVATAGRNGLDVARVTEWKEVAVRYWRRLSVGDIMSSPAFSLRSDATLDDAQMEMAVRGIRHIPIVDAQGHLLGILSERDAFKALAAPGRPRTLTVGQCMQRRVQAVSEDSPVYEAVARMLRDHVGSLPVVGAGDCVVGIMTATDALRLCYDALVEHEPRTVV
jgi:CBS domain-containing protein